MAGEALEFVDDFVALIGEGPVWSVRDQAMYFVDNMGKKIVRLRPPFHSSESRTLPYRPTCLTLLSDGGFLLGYKKGIGLFDFDSGRTEQLPLDGMNFDGVSFNDGACDSAGRLWIGTQDKQAVKPLGALYCMDASRTLRRVVDQIVLSNGMAWSPDFRTFYHVDSRPGRIHAYDFDATLGALSNRRTFVDYAGKGRRPDGCTIDAEGYLWVAEIDGWRIARYAPDGTLDREVMLPVQRPTSLGFGGPDMSTLFITSMSFALNNEAPVGQPHAGKTIFFKPGVKGLPEPTIRGISLQK